MTAIDRLLVYVPRENHEHHCSYFFPTGDEDECNCGLEQRREDAADLEALYQAAKPLESYDLAAGPHDYHGYRLIPETVAENLMRDLAALAAARRRVEGGPPPPPLPRVNKPPGIEPRI